MNDDICTNCGHWKGLHHFETNQCPAGGEAPVGRKQNWLMSIYQAPDKRDATIAAQAATIAQLREALEQIKLIASAKCQVCKSDCSHDGFFLDIDAIAARALKGGE